MKKLLLLLLLLLVSSSAFAQICALTELAVEPTPAWYGEEIDVRMVGGCSSGAGPAGARVIASGSTIVIDVGEPRGGPTIPYPWGERVVLGKLLPGNYELIIRAGEEELRRQTLEVRPRPFRIMPMFGRPGARVALRDVLDIDCLPDCQPIRFGGVPATDYVFDDRGDLRVTVPPHAPGVVDVTLHVDGEVVTLPGGFRYGDAASEADFDRVMFPTTYFGKGTHGSEWFTDIRVQNNSPVEIDTVPQTDQDPPPPILPIPVPIAPGARGRVPLKGTDGGTFFYMPRGADEYLDYASHIVDLSRSTSDLGSELPVVRARDTASEINLPAVPIDSRFRVRLRIYDIDAEARSVLIRATDENGTTHGFGLVLHATRIVCPNAPCLQPEPAFASLDLASIASLRGRRLVDLRITSDRDARLWAFATVTNNETQRVTLHTPQGK